MGFEIFLEFERFVFVRESAVPDELQGLNFDVWADLPAL
jgi:hypothetical protein